MAFQYHTTAAPELIEDEFGTMDDFIASVGRGDDPVAVMLTCWELGAIPDEVSHVREGEVLVVQNPAGVIAPWHIDDPGSVAVPVGCAAAHPSGGAASVCYALNYPTVRHLIVCGHRECRMVPMLLSDRRPDLLTPFREIVSEVREELDRRDGRSNPDRQRTDAIQGVVLQQVRHLKSYPFVRERLNAGTLVLHAWLYDDDSAIVQTFDPRTGRFSE